MRTALWLSLFLMAACGSVDSDGGDDAAVPTADAATGPDGGAGTADAASGATPVRGEIAPGAARLSGSTYQMDVQLGNWASQKPASGTNYTVEGAAPVKP